MRNTSKPTVDLSVAVRLVDNHEPQALTLEELIRAYDAKVCGAEFTRLKKWLKAFGHLSAWEISTEQLSAAAQLMLDAGYKAATPTEICQPSAPSTAGLYSDESPQEALEAPPWALGALKRIYGTSM